jgi:putative hydrolase of the HAD superfamily
MKTHISALVFDFGGVLTRPQDPACVRDIMDMLALDGILARFRSAYFARRVAYDRGAVDVRGYWKGLCDELGVALPEASLPAIIERDNDSWFQYRPSMIEAVAGLKGSARTVALLSNINFEGVARFRATFPRPELFDHLTFSCDLGLMKPERAIFEHCLSAIGAKPEEVLFVDDTAENVVGAQAAGMNAVRFIDEEQFLAELDSFYEIVK